MIPDLIDVVVISENIFITADRYKTSGILAISMQTNDPSPLTKHIVVMVRSSNLSIWLNIGRTIPNEKQFSIVCEEKCTA